MNPGFSSTSTFFQTQECFEFYQQLSFLKAFRYTVEDEEGLKGRVTGYLIWEGSLLKRMMTRRAIIPGGALLDEKITEQQLTDLLHKTRVGLQKQGAIYIEFRNYNDYSKYKTVFEKSGFRYQAHLNFHVFTPSLEVAAQQLTATKRRDLKLADGNGVSRELSDNLNELREYYKLLSGLYTTKIKTPLFPFEFFEKLIRYKWAKFFVVKYKNEVIGGSVCVVLDTKCIYEWFVCGEDYKYKKTFPSTVATWAAIEYAAINGYKMFDMMGAGKPDEGYGVREFKSKFGGTLVEHGRFLGIINPVFYTIGKLAVSILKRLK